MDITELITLFIVIVAYRINKKRTDEVMRQAFKDWQAGIISFEEYLEINSREFNRKHNIE